MWSHPRIPKPLFVAALLGLCDELPKHEQQDTGVEVVVPSTGVSMRRVTSTFCASSSARWLTRVTRC